MLCMDLALLNRFFPPHLLPCAQRWLSKKYMRNSTPPNMLDMNIFSIYLYRKLSHLVHVSNSWRDKPSLSDKLRMLEVFQMRNPFFFAA